MIYFLLIFTNRSIRLNPNSSFVNEEYLLFFKTLFNFFTDVQNPIFVVSTFSTTSIVTHVLVGDFFYNSSWHTTYFKIILMKYNVKLYKNKELLLPTIYRSIIVVLRLRRSACITCRTCVIQGRYVSYE